MVALQYIIILKASDITGQGRLFSAFLFILDYSVKCQNVCPPYLTLNEFWMTLPVTYQLDLQRNKVTTMKP